MSEYRVSGRLYEIAEDGDAEIAAVTFTLFAKDAVEAVDHAADLFLETKFYLALDDVEVEKT